MALGRTSSHVPLPLPEALLPHLAAFQHTLQQTSVWGSVCQKQSLRQGFCATGLLEAASQGEPQPGKASAAEAPAGPTRCLMR